MNINSINNVNYRQNLRRQKIQNNDLTKNSMACKIENQQLNFKARNTEIKKLDDILRKVFLDFPVISTTRLKSFNNIEFFSRLYKRIGQQINENRQSAKDWGELMILTRKHGVGNGNELSFATLLYLFNEYDKKINISLLMAQKNGPHKIPTVRYLDRCVAVVRDEHSQRPDIPHRLTGFGKKDIIIDPILGKVDYWFNLQHEYINDGEQLLISPTYVI